jgi:DNA repair ATPase RecN
MQCEGCGVSLTRTLEVYGPALGKVFCFACWTEIEFDPVRLPQIETRRREIRAELRDLAEKARPLEKELDAIQGRQWQLRTEQKQLDEERKDLHVLQATLFAA